jgi:hypothetical protein
MFVAEHWHAVSVTAQGILAIAVLIQDWAQVGMLWAAARPESAMMAKVEYEYFMLIVGFDFGFALNE